MNRSVLVIGGGVIGLCTAYYCARRGLKVTVLERNSTLHDNCSSGNAGMIVPSHFVPLAAPGMIALGLRWMWSSASPFHIKPRLDKDLLDWGHKFWRAANPRHVERSAPVLLALSLASRECFEELAKLPGVDFGLEQRGLLMLCRTQHGLDDEGRLAVRARALGVSAQVLDANQAAALDPSVRMDIAGAVLYPSDCHLTPARFVATMETETRKLGVEFICDEPATRMKRAGSRIAAVVTPRAEYAADEVVLCGGVWSARLARELGLSVPMEAGKGYSLTLPRPRQRPVHCSILTEARCAVTPMGASLRVGGTMELGGINQDISHVRVRAIIDAFCRYYPEFRPSDFAGLQPWHGLRPCSPDGLPYLGRTRKFTNLSLATGHAMMGLSLGPVSGKLMAELLTVGTTSHDLAQLSPDRYS